MAILLTESAADRVSISLGATGSRLGLTRRHQEDRVLGNSRYVVNYADEIHPEDAVFSKGGAG